MENGLSVAAKGRKAAVSVKERCGEWLRSIVFLGRNPITMVGAVLATGSAFAVVACWAFEIGFARDPEAHPYAGILFYLGLPAVLVLSLLLILAGALRLRHRLVRRAELPALYPRIDLSEPHLRRAAVLISFAVFVSIVIFTTGSYMSIQYMDSVRFCGATCHTVMQPEYAAYLHSPHSQVACVECHVASGAPWFLRANLSGAKQAFAVTFNDYPRPIPMSITTLRPPQKTCEKCHSPQRYDGNMVLVLNHYDSDEANTSETTVLLMKVGGQNGSGPEGIHGHHLSPGTKITYIALDRQRQVIAQVSYTDASGKTIVFRSTTIQATPQQLTQGQHRTMDCVDCHNRPAHSFQLPGEALDQAMSEHYISTDLPYIRKESLAALQTNYPSRQVASRRIAQILENFYETQYPQVVATKNDQLQAAIQAVQQIYLRNVFPQMHIGWGTYFDNIGHTRRPGCFRCHDGNHVAADGQRIPNDCNMCHGILAMNEHSPKILSELGVKLP